VTPSVLVSPLLAAAPGVRHGFFTRQGGVSTGVYASLNAGSGSRDDPSAVAENRRRIAEAFGRPPAALLIAHQIHSPEVVVARAPFSGTRPRADGVVTTAPRLICAVLSADCAPVLLADPDARVSAAVHAGWRGALAGVVESGVAAMVAAGAARERIVAAVGPCIGPLSYEVRDDFRAAFAAADSRFFAASGDRMTFDLPSFLLDRLALAGVAEAEWIGHDTFAEPDLFFSNRRGHLAGEADYGRLLSAIMLEG